MKREIFSGTKLIFSEILTAGSVLMMCACTESGASSVVLERKSLAEPTAEASAEGTPAAELKGVEISFDTKRMPGQASNQYALWVEDSSGKTVKTLYVSSFTGSRRGYEKRPDALVHWVSAANPSAMSDEEIDTFSGATLEEGAHAYVWNLTDQEENKVEQGTYVIKLEGTLFWTSNTLYTAEVDLNHPDSGLSAEEIRSEPDNHKNEDMIQNVKIKKLQD